MGSIINSASWLALLAVCFLSFYYISWTHLNKAAAILLTGTGLLLLSVYIASRPSGLAVLTKKLTTRHSLAYIIGAGIFVRIIWVSALPPIQLSDAEGYVNTAQTLVRTGSYFHIRDGHELKAWIPPGYTMFLAACSALADGYFTYLPTLTNILFYILTSLVVYSVTQSLSNNKTATAAVLILALWPGYIFMTGLALVEPLSLLLFTSGVWAFIKAHQNQSQWKFAALAGIVTGYGALVKPALLILPFLWLLFHVMTGAVSYNSFKKTLMAVLCMATVIAPWTIRNYYALHTFVPISTNGGDVFYRANNPNATGGFTFSGERNLNAYMDNEVLWNKTGLAWGKEWIKENPMEFIKLMLKKQAIFMGEDNTGAYWSLSRAYNENGITYSLLSILSDLWWLLIVFMIAVALIRNREFFSRNPYGGLLLLMTLFFIVIHSVFESQPRYHIPMIGLMAILAALSLGSSSVPVNTLTNNQDQRE